MITHALSLAETNDCIQLAEACPANLIDAESPYNLDC